MHIRSTRTLKNGWSGTIIPDLPSSVRLSLYPLRLKWVIPELTLWTTLFTWSLLKSHHDMFSCSILHREKQKNRTHTALVTDRVFTVGSERVKWTEEPTWSRTAACQTELEQRSRSSHSGWAAAGLGSWTERWGRNNNGQVSSNWLLKHHTQTL